MKRMIFELRIVPIKYLFIRSIGIIVNIRQAVFVFLVSINN